MDKLSIAIKIISCASMLLTGGSMVYNVSSTNTGDSSSIEQSDPNVKVEDNGHGTITSTILPGDDRYKDPNKADDNDSSTGGDNGNGESGNTPPASDSGPTGHTAAPGYSTPEPAQPSYSASTKIYNSGQEWEADVMGLCPSQRPESNFSWDESYLPAIGISSFGKINSPEKAVEIVWDGMKRYGGTGVFGVYGIITDNRSCVNDRYSFRLIPGTDTVEWYMTFGGSKEASPELWGALDATAQRMTAHYQYIDSAYRAKCPNN